MYVYRVWMVDGRKRPGMNLVVRARPEVKPLLLKLGVAALALSFVGFFVSHLRARSRPSARSPRSSAAAAAAAEAKARRKPTGGFKEELRVLKNEEALAKVVINGTSTTTTTTTTTTSTTTTFVGLSPTGKSSGDEEGSLLREINDTVSEEFGRDVETTRANSTPKLESKEETAMEQEIAHLRKLVWSLRERERSLELQLLEYYGMTEQEAAMRELENQLKLNSMETKLYSLKKVNSLQAENQRLQSQLSDYSRAMDELNAARAKIKLMKKKLKSDTLQAKERIASLHQRISVLQCRERKDVRNNAEVEMKLKRLEELENKLTELRMENSKLERENSDLARRLEATQILASSVLEAPEPQASEEVDQLRQANDQLTKDLEQLRTDSCGDAEELVYLRWVNACLRYELRNYQRPPGKTVARDLSKTLSPRSEAKAKQLILEYANSSANERTSGPTDFDSEYSSSSQASNNGEPDDNCVDVSSKTKHNGSSNSKFFSKLRKLVLGKGAHRNKILSADRSAAIYASFERRASFSSCSNDDTIGRDSCNSFSSCITDEAGHTSQLAAGMEAHPDEQHQSKDARFQAPLDTQRPRKLNLEEVYGDDDEIPYKCNKDIDSGSEERSNNLARINDHLLDRKHTDVPEKVELMKYADALKSTRGAESSVGDHQPLGRRSSTSS